MYHGDIRLGDTIDIKFTTRRFSTGAPFTLAGSPVISAYVGNGTTEITAGITLTVDFDSRTGLNNVRVVASSGNGFATATNVQLVITTGTVDSVSVVGEVIGSFSIEARSALMPTTAARTLDVTATGAAGVDWGNVENPTTTINLSGTTVKTATDVEADTADIQTRLPAALTAGGNMKSDALAISGDTVAADNLETMLDGTGGQTLSLGALAIVASSGDAVTISTAGGNGDGISIAANGSGNGIDITPGATGNGVRLRGGATSGTGIYVTTNNGHGLDLTVAGSNMYGINIDAAAGDGIHAIGGGNNDGIHLQGGGSGHGMHLNGGATGDGLFAQGGANGDGIDAEGQGTGVDIRGLVQWNPAWDAEVESEVTDALTAFGVSTLTAAGIRNAVGLASANLDTQLGTIDSVVDAILDDTGTTGVVLSSGTMNSIADAVLIRSVTNTQDTADPHSLTAVILSVLESSRSGTTWTIKKTTGATFTTKTLTEDAAATPVTAVT